RALLATCLSLAVRFALLFAACSLSAQLIPIGQPIPRTFSPPVVFLNGFELNCFDPSFARTFGVADQVLQSTGRVSLFFDYCAAAGPNPSIEDLGDAFATFLAGLKYLDDHAIKVT